MIRIERYTNTDMALWNEFAAQARNSSFLFNRGYMDYHSDRFTDHSLMAFKGKKLSALLPANLSGKTLLSHQGLTYGGWILPPRHIDGTDLLNIFEETIRYCRSEGIERIVYKPIPTIYHQMPSQEDIYALQALGAKMSGCNLSEAICMQANPGFNTLRRRNLRKAELLPCHIVEAGKDPDKIRMFHAMLSQCLAERHDAKPVHTLTELAMLMQRFPENIRIYGVEEEGMMQAGVCIYEYKGVAHCQYIATTPRGREENLLTLLFNHLLHTVYQDYRWFDFGTSNESDGTLNEGLLRQKASFGASGVAYTRYELEI